MLHHLTLASPIGPLRISATDAGITRVTFLDEPAEMGRDGAPADGRTDGPGGLLAEAARQLTAYFEGSRRVFDLPLAPELGATATPFQRRVWEELQRIPHGATISYAALATRVRSVARAVGGANGANPIGVIIPCHRVINADGGLGGYAGGLARKRWLLEHEGALGRRLFPD